MTKMEIKEMDCSDLERNIRWRLWQIKYRAAKMGKEWTMIEIGILDDLQRTLLEKYGITYTPFVP